MRTTLFAGAASLLLLLGCADMANNSGTTNNTKSDERNTVSKPAVTSGETGNPVSPPSVSAGTGTAGSGNANPGSDATPAGTAPASSGTATSSTDSTDAGPDNTAKNQRDRDLKRPVPTDQSNAQKDLNVTAEIRRRIVDLEGLSINARNAKIITTEDGKVTLRGPVETEEEKSRLEQIASDVAGKENVTSELEVNK